MHAACAMHASLSAYMHAPCMLYAYGMLHAGRALANLAEDVVRGRCWCLWTSYAMMTFPNKTTVLCFKSTIRLVSFALRRTHYAISCCFSLCIVTILSFPVCACQRKKLTVINNQTDPLKSLKQYWFRSFHWLFYCSLKVFSKLRLETIIKQEVFSYNQQVAESNSSVTPHLFYRAEHTESSLNVSSYSVILPKIINT